MWFLLLFRIHTCMSVQYTRNILQYLLGHYLTHRQGVSTYFSRDHLNCHSKSLLNQKQKKGNKDSLVLIKGNRIQFLKLPNYYNNNNLLYATIAAQPPPTHHHTLVPCPKSFLSMTSIKFLLTIPLPDHMHRSLGMSAMISAGEMSLTFELILSSNTNKKHMENSEENVHLDITGGLK